MKNYYEILGVYKNATKSEIQEVYHKLAHIYHPDKKGNDKKMKEINEAYSILSDDIKRKEYDFTFEHSNFSEKQNSAPASPQSTTSKIYIFNIGNFLFNIIKKIIGWIFSILIPISIFLIASYSHNNTEEPQKITPSVVASNNQKTTTNTILPQNEKTNMPSQYFNNSKEKCVIEDKNIKICDLFYSSSINEENRRNIYVEGNVVSCVNTITEEVYSNKVGQIIIKVAPFFCVTDFGYVYIDPTLEVYKYYGNITRKNYDSPYKINKNYDTCLWSYNDGNGNIPYLELLSDVGPRTGYDVKAFCLNENKGVDIYSYNE